MHLWDELSKHIPPVFIVSETAGVFYGLKTVLRPPGVFMEEEQRGGGQKGEINSDPWWGRLKRRKGGGHVAHLTNDDDGDLLFWSEEAQIKP